MDFKKERVDLHNQWPKKKMFKAEEQFRNLIDTKNQASIFFPADIPYSTGAEYQIFVGHFVDGLEALPFRPDYFFDHCFRVIDCGAKPIFPNKGIKGIVQGLGVKFNASDPNEWATISQQLTALMPLSSYRYVAKRIYQAHFGSDPQSSQISGRASDFFGPSRYAQFLAKFVTPFPLTASGEVPYENLQKVTNFLKLYISGNLATKAKPATHLKLDMSDKANIPSSAKRIEFLLSLFLFISRNERAHGNMLSPFRTSKATLDRYEGFYFATLSAYIFALGVIQLRNIGGPAIAEIVNCCALNAAIQVKLFGR
ncbi:MAG: hypothetical protein V4693_23340 [Pseudomonadota bacterium]